MTRPRTYPFEGEKIGRLTFIRREETPEGDFSQGLWRCECGKHLVARINNVRSGGTNSCGCGRGRPRWYPKENEKFGRLTFIGPVEAKHRKPSLGSWKCDCGEEIVRTINCVKTGGTRSCGCLKDEAVARLIAGRRLFYAKKKDATSDNIPYVA